MSDTLDTGLKDWVQQRVRDLATLFYGNEDIMRRQLTEVAQSVELEETWLAPSTIEVREDQSLAVKEIFKKHPYGKWQLTLGPAFFSVSLAYQRYAIDETKLKKMAILSVGAGDKFFVEADVDMLRVIKDIMRFTDDAMLVGGAHLGYFMLFEDEVANAIRIRSQA